MSMIRALAAGAFALACLVSSSAASAADYPAPKQGEWIARDFKFHTGEVMGELRLHYTTIGNPSGIPVVVLHGTTGSAQSMLTPAFAGERLAPARRSTRRSITSSSPTASVTANRRSPRTG